MIHIRRKLIAYLLAAALLLPMLPTSSAALPGGAYESAEELTQAARELMDEYLDPDAYLDLGEFGLTQAQTSALTALAKTITKDCDTAYDRILAVAAWVADNTYYDYQTYYGEADRAQDPYSVYASQLAICYGYSNLAAFLLRTLGIPCLVIHGLVPTQNNAEHRWEAAWDGTSWLFFDAGWMSQNRSYNGETLQYGGYNTAWFDYTAEREASQRQFAFPSDTLTIGTCTYDVTLDWSALTLDLDLEGSLANFKARRTYDLGTFSDVAGGDWYFGSVAAAYRLGLMDGDGEGRFRPADSVTVAEAIKIAAILHDIYSGGDGEFASSSQWYRVYVTYAYQQGMIDKTVFSDYELKATRAELAYILARALPEDCLEAVNPAATIPDVSGSDAYYSEIRLLYRAGVLTGVDSAGRFEPDAYVTRAQLAAVIARLTDPSARVG